VEVQVERVIAGLAPRAEAACELAVAADLAARIELGDDLARDGGRTRQGGSFSPHLAVLFNGQFGDHERSPSRLACVAVGSVEALVASEDVYSIGSSWFVALSGSEAVVAGTSRYNLYVAQKKRPLRSLTRGSWRWFVVIARS
jgi:hypothetical protein